LIDLRVAGLIAQDPHTGNYPPLQEGTSTGKGLRRASHHGRIVGG